MSNFLIGLVILLMVCGSLSEAADSSQPFTIIRASSGDDGEWDVHQFVLLPETGPPGSITPAKDADGLNCSVMDYALFRARYLLKVEAGLREGLAQEFRARSGIKRTSYITTYLFCSPFWPMHILWELPLAGVEKERMLDMRGITIVMPSVETGGLGEIPCRIDDSGVLHFTGGVLDNQAWSETTWQGAGLHLSYRIQGELNIPELFPGWPVGTRGTVLLFLEGPSYLGYEIDLHGDGEDILASLWPGRYERALARTVHVFSNQRSFLGYSRSGIGASGGLSIKAFGASGFREHEKSGGIETLRNGWPRFGGMIREKAWVMYLTGLILLFAIFHMINLFFLKIKYRGLIAGAFYDPIVSQICILVLATIFAPFLGLGWIAGAYAAGRYLQWRHPAVPWAWPAMLAYALLTACAFEAIFLNPLWV